MGGWVGVVGVHSRRYLVGKNTVKTMRVGGKFLNLKCKRKQCVIKIGGEVVGIVKSDSKIKVCVVCLG